MINLIKKWLNRKSHNEELIYTESIESTPSIDPIEIEDELPVVIEDEIEVEEVSESEEKFLSLSKEMTMNRNSIYSEIIEFIPTGIRTSVMNLNIIQRNQMFLRYLGCPNRTLHENDKIWSSLKNIDILKMTLPEIEISIKSLWDYLNPSENDKKKYGEVFTPFDLVNEMLDTLPTYVWSNPNLKWLEPANGVGNFAIVIIKRLMIGLEGWEPDEEKRYKHIIENMIYVCELQSKNMFVWLFTIDPSNKYDVKFYRDSFLGNGFTDKMKEWGVEKFDVIVGNPPYQSDTSEENSANSLWVKFLEKSSKIYNEYILYITPNSWLGNEKVQNAHSGRMTVNKVRSRIFEKNSLIYVNYGKRINDLFNVSLDFCYYLVGKSFTCKTKINSIEVEYETLPFIPIEPESISIINKISSLSKIKIEKNTHPVFESDTRKWKGLISKDMTKDHIYPICNTSAQYNKEIFFWSKNTHPEQNTKKVIMSDSGYLRPFFDDGKYGVSSHSLFIRVSNEEEARSLISYLESKFLTFLSNMKPNSGSEVNVLKIRNLIPIVPLDRIWTDDQLFEYFSMSEEEKNLVKNYDKKI